MRLYDLREDIESITADDVFAVIAAIALAVSSVALLFLIA